MKKAPEEFREVAQIIINLRGNPQQICVRYASLKTAEKQFNTLNKALHNKGGVERLNEVVTLTGDTLTFVGLLYSIEAWSLLSVDAHMRMMQPRAPQG